RYPDTVQIETRQGGLFEDFSPVREQWARMSGGRWKDSVGAFFEAVSSQHRMPMAADAMVDSSDDFNSTWPACIAAKAADLQGADPGWRYLRRLREAWCLEGRGIHRKDVQADVAKETGLDVDAFVRALDDGSANEAFQRDRDECQALGISGFPTFVIRRDDETRQVDGWRPWDAFEEIVRDVEPHLEAAPLQANEDAAMNPNRIGSARSQKNGKGEASPQKDFRSPHIAPAKTSRPAIRPTVPPATAIRATPAIPATTAPFRRFACVTL